MLKLLAFVRFFSRNGTRLGMKGKKKSYAWSKDRSSIFRKKIYIKRY